MLDKEQFFKDYPVWDDFVKSDLKWEVLQEIHEDYQKRDKDFKSCAQDIKEYILKDISDGGNIVIHSICSRVKNPEHLIEKIIRKRGNEQSQKYEGINVMNYHEIVRDLVGVRILILAKEQWEEVFDWLMMKFPESSKEECRIVEQPKAYTRYGDRDIFHNKIHREHTNKGYRSQHYVVEFKRLYCEIQVRTLAEEVYGEFDHKVKYPYRENNRFLKRYTSIVSQLLNSVDEIISTCFQLGEEGWKDCESFCKEDTYIDWKNISQWVVSAQLTDEVPEKTELSKRIDVAEYGNNTILRKG